MLNFCCPWITRKKENCTKKREDTQVFMKEYILWKIKYLHHTNSVYLAEFVCFCLYHGTPNYLNSLRAEYIFAYHWNSGSQTSLAEFPWQWNFVTYLCCCAITPIHRHINPVSRCQPYLFRFCVINLEVKFKSGGIPNKSKIMGSNI